MATFNNGESGLSVRNKLNTIINKVEGVTDIDNDINVDGVNLTAIAETISDTAVDIFVYDTRKDSDGGAWRKRTQHTSWYNETLNTATRGSRKEFPAVAVIVAEAGTITIYDGDDPDLPMWMVFNPNGVGSVMLGSTTTYPNTGITAKNGIIAKSANLYGIATADFVKDTGDIFWNTTSNRRISLNPIVGRNIASSDYTTDTTVPIADNNANDVAMTVLPNAPIDAATGLPVPTIAVATNGGTSVITDSGAVYDITRTGGHNVVAIIDDDKIAVNRKSGGNDVFIHQLPLSADTNDFTGELIHYGGTGNIDLNISLAGAANLEQSAVSGATGLAITLPNYTTPNSSMFSKITSDYNTGWMNGDIKLATLSDTDDTNVTGSELVTNGTFDTDTSGWTALNSATLSVVSGALRISQTTVDYGRAEQAITVEVGKTYTVSVELKGGTGAARVILGTTSEGTQYYIGSVLTAAQTISTTFTATTTTAYLTLTNDTTTDNTYYDFDNISVRLAEEDRSVNG